MNLLVIHLDVLSQIQAIHRQCNACESLLEACAEKINSIKKIISNNYSDYFHRLLFQCSAMILFGKFAVVLQCCHDVSSVINIRLSWLLSVTKIMWHSEDSNNNYYYYFNKVYNYCLLVVILESPVDQTCGRQQFLFRGGGGGEGCSLEYAVGVCRPVLQILTMFICSGGSLKNHTRFQTIMVKIYTRFQQQQQQHFYYLYRVQEVG